MEKKLQINWLAVIVAALVYFALGAIWYGPIFGEAWVQGAFNMSMSEFETYMSATMQSGMASPAFNYIITFLLQFATAFVLWVILFISQSLNMGKAILVAVIFWFAFNVAPGMIEYLFDQSSTAVFMIHKGYHLVGYVLIAVILVLWKPKTLRAQ